MRKLIFGIIVLISIVAVSEVAGAVSFIPLADQAKNKSKAADNSNIINKSNNDFTLSPPGLERALFIHYKKDFAKPPWAGGDKGNKEPKCYEFLAKEAYWKNLPINYIVHPDLETTASGTAFLSAETWDDETSVELFSNTYSVDGTATWDGDVPDGRNELVFGNYPQQDVIAVTVAWGYFSGSPSSRRIVEFDILFDTDYTWGDATVNPSLMDLQNIAVHEIGHGIGLADIYSDSCSAVTMYGYSSAGEISKRSLERPDITGLQKMYGI